MPSVAEALTSHPFGSGTFDPLEVQYYHFVNYTDDGGPDRALHPGYDFGPFLLCFNTTPSILVGDADPQPATSSFSCPSNGLGNGNQVRFDTDGMLPTGLFLATYYFVVGVTTNTFQVSLTSGGPPVAFLDAGIGHMNVTKRGTPFDLTGATPFAWVKTLPTDPDGSKLIDLAPTIVAPNTLGTVQILVLGTNSNSLVNANAFWNMEIKLVSGARFNLVRGSFQIEQLPTHPSFP